MRTSSTLWIDRAALARQIEDLISRLHPTVTLERRRDDRLELPLLLSLTPLNADARPIEKDAITVIGKNISRAGLSFYHVDPVPFRRAIIRAQDAEFSDFAAEIDLNWCRFNKPGWYESGGRLIARLPSAQASQAEVRQFRPKAS
jgi:hypothetical protein